jgi:hypothetical protein
MPGGGGAPRGGSVEFSGGALWSQGFDLGDRSATLTRNPATGSAPFELFTADTRFDAAPAGQARLGVYLARSISIEGGLQYSRPVLRTRLANDAEGAEAITASETVTRLVVDGSVVVHLLPLSFGGGRGVPFLLGGGGYVRELHEENELVETGREIHVGGGIKYWFGSGRKRAGLRGDLGVSMREKGADFSDNRRMLPTAGVSFLYLF